MSKLTRAVSMALLALSCLAACNKPSDAVSSTDASSSAFNPVPSNAPYTGNGDDLFTARLRGTTKTAVINPSGGVVFFQSGKQPCYSVGAGLVYVPDKGFYHYNGQLAFDKEFEYFGRFAEGLAPAAVKDGQGSKYGFIDTSGEFVIEPAFSSASEFSQGFAAVGLDGDECGYINRKGELAYRGFSETTPFSEDLAAVSVLGSEEKISPMGYIGLDGAFVIEPIYQSASAFSDGVAAVAESTERIEDRIYGYIDASGEYVIEPMFGSAGSFANGVAVVSFGDLFNWESQLVNRQGELVIYKMYEWASLQKKSGNGIFIAKDFGADNAYFMDGNGEPILLEYCPV